MTEQLAAMRQMVDAVEADLKLFNIPATAKMVEALSAGRAAISQAETAQGQEPVGEAYLCNKCQTPFDGAWECPSCGHRSATKEPVYTTPPAAQRQWVGLTQEDIDIAFDDTQEGGGFNEFAYAIEQRLKEKNT